MASRAMRSSTMKRTQVSIAQASSKRNTPRKRAKHETALGSKADLPKPSEPLKVDEENGDIFDAPANALIIHACNCKGSWGAGIAKAFHDRYPKAYAEYNEHCKKIGDKLLDHAQLIAPVDYQASNDAPKHFVGCLFTSRHYGKQRDTPSRILAATKPAIEELLNKVDEYNADAKGSDHVGEVRICKINSGLFGVPWESTKPVLESIDVSKHDVKEVKVVSPPG